VIVRASRYCPPYHGVEGRRFSVHSSSINPTFQVVLLLGGYSTSASCNAPYLYIASTCWKLVSTIPPLDLPSVSIGTFPEGMTIFLDSGQVSGSSTGQCLIFTSNFWINVPGAWCLTSCALERFSFLDPRATYATLTVPWLHHALTWLRLDHYAYTSIGGLRDMGTHGPPQRTRPVRSPADLQVGLKTLSTTPATLEDSRRPYADPGESAKLVAQDSPPGRDLTLPVGPQITRFAL
jgi:hypothetical protein